MKHKFLEVNTASLSIQKSERKKIELQQSNSMNKKYFC